MESSPGYGNCGLVCFAWITVRVWIQNEGFPPHILGIRNRNHRNGKKRDLGHNPKTLHGITLIDLTRFRSLLMMVADGVIEVPGIPVLMSIL
jgi:hypothetical protein